MKAATRQTYKVLQGPWQRIRRLFVATLFLPFHSLHLLIAFS